MHEVNTCNELIGKNKIDSPKKIPKNFLVANSLYTKIKLSKKVKDFVDNRKHKYVNDIIQNAFN